MYNFKQETIFNPALVVLLRLNSFLHHTKDYKSKYQNGYLHPLLPTSSTSTFWISNSEFRPRRGCHDDEIKSSIRTNETSHFQAYARGRKTRFLKAIFRLSRVIWRIVKELQLYVRNSNWKVFINWSFNDWKSCKALIIALPIFCFIALAFNK